MEFFMKATLKSLRQVRANPAVSIFVKTHRTHPDNSQDAIALKNQLAVTQERLVNEYDKRTADGMMSSIYAQTETLDHNYNLDSLAIFASPDNTQVLRLPFDVVERVVIGDKFATRELARELSQAVHYYVLVVTSEKARLIEAVNDRLVKEIGNDSTRQEAMSELTFPINNTTLPTGSKSDRTGSSDDHSYLKEFMNRVDKSLQEFVKIDPLPVILVGDSRTMGFFEQMCDNPSIIIGKADHIANLKEGRADDIIKEVQTIVAQKRDERFNIALGNLEKARNDKMVRTDLQQIYRSVVEGNAITLLVKQGYIVPAIIDEQNATLLVQDDPTGDGVTDDAVGEIIELMTNNGGEVVFVPADKMNDNEPIALITRY